MFDDLFCKIYLHTMLDIERLYTIICGLVSGEKEPIRTIITTWCEMDLRKNDSNTIQTKCVDLNDFVFWEYYLDVYPRNVGEDIYISEIANLIKSLKDININVVASCDFEDRLQ